ncbi:maleylpyruvate isomerase family mycothiol-dependent enzyme [Kribbella albertanoniae]|uniref:Maleylpyruvate isomerase family mycothiol-dependent enzyme n=1 Tax=Kribbella albertanoniae TaxID=1266829 RepID=A0A4R4Q221_9ACTN|nr:maleylpyruvate isomerase family mycothiol-dependent enzyme [Kribbella albertanoniae]TDC28994.1 maleylpyruvate isomerase family mycothiol-dependent enzyme [Kribbella albertanoniae]
MDYSRIEAERLDLADFLDTLTDADWRVTSLCPAWTVHDVVAHLTLSTRTTLSDVLRGAIRARGNWERMEADAAVERAARFTPAELIAQFRETAASTKRSPGSKPIDTLTDALVHGQDIAIPLGREREMPLDLAQAALDHVLKSPFYGARKRFRDSRLTATDADWSAGAGSTELRGPVQDLLLVATGREARAGQIIK